MLSIYLVTGKDRQGVAELAKEEGIDFSYFEKCYGVILSQKPDKYLKCLDDIVDAYSGRTVVVIDDEPELLGMTEVRLNGCDVRAYTNSRKAVDDIKDGKAVPAVVVTDLQMPGMSGFDVIRDIREWEKGLYNEGDSSRTYTSL